MDEEVRNPNAAAGAAIVAFLLALVSAFVFVSHVLIFVFPIMPLGAWLGWEGRNSRLRVLALIGGAVCLALTAFFLYVMVRSLTF